MAEEEGAHGGTESAAEDGAQGAGGAENGDGDRDERRRRERVMRSYEETYCVFQGGGALGVCHVGVLRAIEEFDEYEVKGYAGASAGALVAALAAAGYKGKDIIGDFNKERRELPSILSALKDPKVKVAVDLLGDDWRSVKRLRELTDNTAGKAGQAAQERIVWRANWLAARTTIASTVLLVALVSGIVYWFFDAQIALAAAAGLFLSALFVLFVAFRRLWRLVRIVGRGVGGVANLDTFRDALERLLQKKLRPNQDLPPGQEFDSERLVTFAELEDSGKALKIVASNIVRGRLELFSPKTTPNASVADAVAASVAIPIVFRPRKVRRVGEEYSEKLYTDGGLVANRPVFAFDEERAENKNMLCIVSSFPEQKPQAGQRILQPLPERPWRQRSLSEMRHGLDTFVANARTAIFGASDLDLRAAGRHIDIVNDLKTKDGEEGGGGGVGVGVMSVLDFDASMEKVEEYVKKSQLLTRKRLDLERAIHRNNEVIREEMIQIVADLLRLDRGEVQVRCALAVLDTYFDNAGNTFSLKYCKGFDLDPDERATLPVTNAAVEASLQRGGLAGVEATDLNPERNRARREQYFNIGPDGWARKVTPESLQWSICMPAHLLSQRIQQDSPLQLAYALDGFNDLGDHLYEAAKRIEDYVNRM